MSKKSLVLVAALGLLATPVLYSLLDDVVLWFRNKVASKSPVDRGRDELAALDRASAAVEDSIEPAAGTTAS